MKVMFKRHSAFAIAALLLLAGCSEEKASAPPQQRPVLTAQVIGHPEVMLTFPGTIEPQISTQKAFRVAGQVVSKNVTVGDEVKKGDVLAVLDTSQLLEGVRSAEAVVTSAEAQLNNARSVNERVDALSKEGFASPAQTESASQSLAAANAQLESAQAQLEKAREQINYAELVADYDGIVTASTIEVGETVAAGAPAVTIARPDLRDAVIDVPDDVVRRLKIGDVFRVTTLLQPDKTIDGKVREIAPDADKLTHTVRVKISLGNAPEIYRIGTTVSATSEKATALMASVPANALMEKDGKLQVWKIDTKASKAELTAIDAAPAKDGMYVVKSGLSIGDRVAVAGIHEIKDGQSVTLAEEAAQ